MTTDVLVRPRPIGSDYCDSVLDRLRREKSALQALGIQHLSVFGSLARGQATAASDIDLAVTLSGDMRVSLLGFVGLERRLEDLLGRPVDLVLEPTQRPELQQAINLDRVRAF